MSINKFLTKENVELLWDVLIDEPIIKKMCNSPEKNNELINIFESNLKGFFLSEKNNYNSLIELNKKYILLIINYLTNLQKNTSTTSMPKMTRETLARDTQQFKKIKIHEDIIQQPITYEDIHNERITQFEKNLNKKQEEFSNAMKIPLPPLPDFSDKVDEPLNEIELEIKKIQEQRNYDIEIINKNNIIADTKWLESQETSIKTERLNFEIPSNKHISWSDNNKFYEPDQYKLNNQTSDTSGYIEQIHQEQDIYSEANIFSKLKKINEVEPLQSQSQTQPIVHIDSQIELQSQIDELKNEMSALNNKINLILEKLDNKYNE
jgi:hypothetical protein